MAQVIELVGDNGYVIARGAYSPSVAEFMLQEKARRGGRVLVRDAAEQQPRRSSGKTTRRKTAKTAQPRQAAPASRTLKQSPLGGVDTNISPYPRTPAPVQDDSWGYGVSVPPYESSGVGNALSGAMGYIRDLNNRMIDWSQNPPYNAPVPDAPRQTYIGMPPDPYAGDDSWAYGLAVPPAPLPVRPPALEGRTLKQSALGDVMMDTSVPAPVSTMDRIRNYAVDMDRWNRFTDAAGNAANNMVDWDRWNRFTDAVGNAANNMVDWDRWNRFTNSVGNWMRGINEYDPYVPDYYYGDY